MKKKVNVFPVSPIYNIKCPILGTVFSSNLTVGDIGCCLQSRARVQEILEDGTLVNLNLSNYKDDNSYLMKNKPMQPVRNQSIKMRKVENKPKESSEEVNEVISEVSKILNPTQDNKEKSVEEVLDDVIEEALNEDSHDNNQEKRKNKNKKR